jgi:glycine/D-amino acid oxidase-like deaminating enzyme
MIGARGSFGARQPERYFAGLRAAAVKMFPALRDVRWEMSWGGPFALTTDHLPHIHNPAPGLYAALGCNGRGVALASQIGPLLADLCLGRPADDLPIPVTRISAIPFHFLRRPALEAVALWYRALDYTGR